MIGLEEAGKFHGHLGPFLALGYVAGSLAVKELKPEDERSLTALLELPFKTPYTCVIDGVQCSSGCTLGKGNLRVEGSLDSRVVLEFRKGDKGLRLEVRDGVLERVLGMGLEEGAKWILERRAEELFKITRL